MTEPLAEPLPAAALGLRPLFADSAIYGLSVAALPVALILATPFVARALGPEEFGAVDVLMTLVSLAGVVGAAGMDTAAVRSYFDYSADEGERRRTVIRTAVLVAVAASIAIAIVSVAAGLALGAASPAVSAGAIVVAAALMPLTTGQLIARTAFLLARRRLAYLAAGLLNAALGASAAVALVVAGLGPAGYFLGLGFGSAAALAFCFAAGGIARGSPRLDRREATVMLRYGLPLVPAAAAAWMIFAVDRSLIVAFKGLDDAGRYGVAAKVTAPMLLVATAFAIAWGPFIVGQPAARRRELRVRALPAIGAAAGVAFLWLVLFADELVDLLGGGEFTGADRAVPGLALGWLAWTVAIVLQTELGVSRRTRTIALVTGVGAVANVVANVALIPPFGFVGAAWATAGAFALLAGIYAVYERRLDPTPHDVRALAGIVLVIAAASAALLTDAVAIRALAALGGTLLLVLLVRTRRA